MKRSLFISVISLVFAVSCTQEFIGSDKVSGTDVQMSFIAGFEESDLTKVALTGSPSDGVRQMQWSSEDCIVVSNGSVCRKFENIASEAGSVAEFKGNIPEGKAYYAYYPYSETVSLASDKFNFNIPSIQKYLKDGVSPECLPMVAKLEDGSFKFKNLCGIVVFRLTGEGAVKSVAFSASDAYGRPALLAGSATVSMSYDSTPVLVMKSDASYTAILDCTDADGKGVTLSPDVPTAFHIVVPAGQYADFKIRVRMEGNSMTKKSTKALVVKRSERTTMNAVPFEGVGNDLSAGGTANCYLVSSYGGYVFDATVKGNSNEMVGNISSAEVLWETQNEPSYPAKGSVVSDVKLEGGNIFFKANSDGNALIVAKNAGGTILWSWHIWVCDGYDAAASAQVYYNGAGLFMDRNLGALSATPGDKKACGLAYQWGRKDPFKFHSSGNADYYDYYFTEGYYERYIQSSNSTGTIEYSVAHPNHILGRCDNTRDWLYSDVKELVDTTRWMSKKTMYDPCPPGWKVISGDSAEKIFGNGRKQNIYDSSNNGYNTSGHFGDSPVIWYPLGGNDAWYWEARARGEDVESEGIEYRHISTYIISFHSGGYYNGWTSGSEQRSFIRCQDERTVPTVVTIEPTIASNGAVTAGGFVTYDGGFGNILETGVAYCDYSFNPDYKDNSVKFIKCASAESQFSVKLDSLVQGTTYYLRAYAKNLIGSGYGPEMSFTAPVSGGNEGVGRGDDYNW